MSWLAGYLSEAWTIFLQLSPSLLLGLFLAALLHVFLPRDLIRRRLSGSSTRAVLEAVAIGVPMPLCSCGVVPAAIGLRQDGAGRGAATGFLISTPQTGLDSILVSASLLGWPFALFKVGAAFVTGLIGGLLVNATEPREEAVSEAADIACGDSAPRRHWLPALWHYAVFELLAAIDLYLILGIALAALIGVLVPPGYLATLPWTQGPLGMLLVLAIAMPLYVCTTSSVPIAASLIGAGLPLGSALVFLMAGPATNIATIGMVARAFGRRVLFIYLGVVAIFSMLFGVLFDWVLADLSFAPVPACHAQGHAHDFSPIDYLSAALLLALLAFLLGRRLLTRFAKRAGAAERERDMDLVFKVDGMSCGHCVARVETIARKAPGVAEVRVDLAAGTLALKGRDVDAAALVAALEAAGYAARLKEKP